MQNEAAHATTAVAFQGLRALRPADRMRFYGVVSQQETDLVACLANPQPKPTPWQTLPPESETSPAASLFYDVASHQEEAEHAAREQGRAAHPRPNVVVARIVSGVVVVHLPRTEVLRFTCLGFFPRRILRNGSHGSNLEKSRCAGMARRGGLRRYMLPSSAPKLCDVRVLGGDDGLGDGAKDNSLLPFSSQEPTPDQQQGPPRGLCEFAPQRAGGAVSSPAPT